MVKNLPTMIELPKNFESGFYFAHPCHAWERGLNENTDGLIRQYFLKTMGFENIPNDQIQMMMNRVNDRPRQTLGFATPNYKFFNLKYNKAA